MEIKNILIIFVILKIKKMTIKSKEEQYVECLQTINGLSLEDLEQGYTSNTIEYIKALGLLVPPHPRSAPQLKSGHSEEELKKYVVEFGLYQKEAEEYKTIREIWKQIESVKNNLLEMYVKKQANLETVHESLHYKLWELAWEQGHAHGYYEVFLHLSDLVDVYQNLIPRTDKKEIEKILKQSFKEANMKLDVDKNVFLYKNLLDSLILKFG